MKNRILSLLAAVTVATAALTAPPAPAGARTTTEQLDPASLGRGASPRVDRLAGRVLHASTGEVVRLPRTWRPSHLRLVGRVGSAWYVQRWDRQFYEGWLYRVTAAGPTRLQRSSDWGSGFLGWYLTADRQRIVRYNSDGYGACWLAVVGLRGKVLARHGCGYDGNYIGATSAQVWYTPFSPTVTRVWAPAGSTTSSLGVKGYLADPDHDLLFLRPTGSTPGGPTSLTTPGAPDWAAAFRAVTVSPTGTYVAGFASGVLQVRRVSDGSVVRQLATSGTSGLRWESGTRLLIAVTGRSDWIVRCPLSGDCHTASGPADAPYRFDQVPSWHAETMGD